MNQSNFKFDSALTREEHDAFVTKQPNCNLLQSAQWAEVKSEWGAMRVGVRNESNEIVAAGLVLIRPLKFGYTMWYMPHGPILDYNSHAILETFLSGIKMMARKSKCVFVRIDPPVHRRMAFSKDIETTPVNIASDRVIARFAHSGFNHLGFTEEMHQNLQPRFTTVTVAPEAGAEFLPTLPRRTRRFVKDAAARFVEVTRGGLADLDDFMSVIEKTEQTKGVRLRNKDYYEKLLTTYGDNARLYLGRINLVTAMDTYQRRIAEAEAELSKLTDKAPKRKMTLTQQIASYKKNLAFLQERHPIDGDVVAVAGCIAVLYGTGFEMLYAGMNRDYGKIPAQDAVYVSMMQEAFDDGAAYACIGGVENDLNDGLLEFKEHFNAQVVEKIGEFDFPVRKTMYRAIKFALDHR